MEVQRSGYRLIFQIVPCCIGTCSLALFHSLAPQTIIDALILSTVTTRINIFCAGFHPGIDHNRAVHFKTCLFCHCGIGPHAAGNHHHISREHLAILHTDSGDKIFSLQSRDLNAGTDFDILRFTYLFQKLGCRFIQLASHDHRGKLQHCHTAFCFLQFPGSLQAKHTAADHCHIFHLGKHIRNLLRIIQPADCKYVLLLHALHRRHKTLCSKSIDKLRIFQLHAVIQNHLFAVRINPLHPASQNLEYSVLLIPGSLVHSDLTGI